MAHPELDRERILDDFHMFSGISYDGFGVESSETCRVTSSGAASRVDFDRDFFVV